ncbi:hypothetical protein [Segetibacter koreensis]|nr:hypothetical protein [Segetibacter koreensis]
MNKNGPRIIIEDQELMGGVFKELKIMNEVIFLVIVIKHLIIW